MFVVARTGEDAPIQIPVNPNMTVGNLLKTLKKKHNCAETTRILYNGMPLNNSENKRYKIQCLVIE